LGLLQTIHRLVKDRRNYDARKVRIRTFLVGKPLDTMISTSASLFPLACGRSRCFGGKHVRVLRPWQISGETSSRPGRCSNNHGHKRLLSGDRNTANSPSATPPLLIDVRLSAPRRGLPVGVFGFRPANDQPALQHTFGNLVRAFCVGFSKVSSMARFVGFPPLANYDASSLRHQLMTT